jgi:phosphatidylserine decarboxylase
MFHKEGTQSILLGTIFTAVVLLLSDYFIVAWFKMSSNSNLIVTNNHFAIF